MTGLLAPVWSWCRVPGWAPSPVRICPACPPLAPVPPGKLVLRALGTRALWASWDSSGGSAWLHLLLTDLLGGSNLTAGVTRGVSSHTFPCLSPGTPYTLTLSAVTGPHWAAGPSATEWTRECWGFAGHCRGPSAKQADPAMRGAFRVLQGRGEAQEWLVVKAPTPKVTVMTIAVCRPHARHFCVAHCLTPISCAVPRDGGETKVQRQGPVLRLRSVRAGLSPGTQCPSAQGRAFSLWGRWRNQAARSEPVAATAWLWISRQSACHLCASASAP